jgi:hypothetical protein
MTIKFSQLPLQANVTGTYIVPVVGPGPTSYRTTLDNIGAYLLTGNAATATKLATARTINGVAFDGSANISITASVSAATTSAIGGVIIPVVGTSGITNSNGTIGLATATTSQLGGVKVDGTTVTINGSGVISAAPLQSTAIHAFAFDANKNLIYTTTTGQAFNYTTDGQNSSYVMVDIGTDVYSYSLDASGNLIATFSS